MEIPEYINKKTELLITPEETQTSQEVNPCSR